jgi:hypothetical protein
VLVVANRTAATPRLLVVQNAVRDGNFDEIIIFDVQKLGAARDCRPASPDDPAGRVTASDAFRSGMIGGGLS